LKRVLAASLRLTPGAGLSREVSQTSVERSSGAADTLWDVALR